jgi:ATP-dependent RNA helicase RhlE
VPDNYVHRIGRTARAGREGEAIAFCAPEEAELLHQIQKLMKTEIPVASGTSPLRSEGGKAGRREGSAPRRPRGGGNGGAATQAPKRRRPRRRRAA